MRISDWSSDVCSSDLDRLAQYLVEPAGAHISRRIDLRILLARGANRAVELLANLRVGDGGTTHLRKPAPAAAHAAKGVADAGHYECDQHQAQQAQHDP